MPRVLFEKAGDSIWISHLDLMRVFQRACRRAGLLVKHSKGFTPRAVVSLALPLSVGIESCCELLDFELEGDIPVPEDLVDRLNEKLPAGIRVLNVISNPRKIKELAYLKAEVDLEYDNGIPSEAENQITQLFNRDSLVLKKHSRKGEIETNILPMLREMRLRRADRNTLVMEVTVCAQNPSLNPQLLAAAVEAYLPELRPDFAKCRRVEILDVQGMVFR